MTARPQPRKAECGHGVWFGRKGKGKGKGDLILDLSSMCHVRGGVIELTQGYEVKTKRKTTKKNKQEGDSHQKEEGRLPPNEPDV